MERKYQFKTADTVQIAPETLKDNNETAVYWLSAAGVLINTHGTIILVDPCLVYTPGNPPVNETGDELLVIPPISVEDLPKVDAVLYTHADCDHLGGVTLKALADKFPDLQFHGTLYTCFGKPLPGTKPMAEYDVPKNRCIQHKVGETFFVGDVRITLTPADHSWHLDPDAAFNASYDPVSFTFGDCCGFRIETKDGIVWTPGDTRLLSDHFRMRDVDLCFFDAGNDGWHFGNDGIVRLFNRLPGTHFIYYHGGTVYAPEKAAFNGDPTKLTDRLNDPKRLHVLAPGEKYVLTRTASK